MSNYMNISDRSQSLLLEIAQNRNGAPSVNICQAAEWGEKVGLNSKMVSVAAKELQKAQIVDIDGPGKTMILFDAHILDFERKFLTVDNETV